MARSDYLKWAGLAQDLGIRVTVYGPDSSTYRIPDDLWAAVWDEDPKSGPPVVQGLYHHHGKSGRSGPDIVLRFAHGTPQWFKAGVLAHEIGHHLDYLLDCPEGGDKYGREKSASYRAWEVAGQIGVNRTQTLRRTLNLSILSHGAAYGYGIGGFDEARKDTL